MLSQAFYDVNALQHKVGFTSHDLEKLGKSGKIEDVSQYSFQPGADLSKKTVEAFVESCKANMKVLKKVVFVLGDKSTKFEALIALSDT